MELEHFSYLDSFSSQLQDWDQSEAANDGDFTIPAEMRVELVAAIQGVRDEFRKAQMLAIETGERMVDGFVIAGLSAGHDVPTAYRQAMQAMQAREQLTEQRVDSLLDSASEGADNGDNG